MVYVYSIIDEPAIPTPAILGLDGAALQTLEYRDIGAVISLSSTGKVSQTEANLWQHEAVVEALMPDHAVLPMRFGAMLADEAAVVSALSSRYDEFAAGLNCVRGHVELALRILSDDDVPLTRDQRPTPVSGSGRDYMLAQIEEQRKFKERSEGAKALAEDVHASLALLSAESVRRTLVTPRLLLTAAYLVKREQVEAFRQEAAMLSSANPGVRLLCTGPWPPYNFAVVKNE